VLAPDTVGFEAAPWHQQGAILVESRAAGDDPHMTSEITANSAADGASRKIRRHSRLYSQRFFDSMRDGSYRSAMAAGPKILEIHPARSVIDVGCGAGAWLKAFTELGVARVAGVDGTYVDRKQLMIDSASFMGCDLDEPLHIQKLFQLLGTSERFDLAISLEVGEHLPVARATSLVGDLCALSDTVLFGAAIPFQGWQSAHVNEQWQSFWANKFAANGYDAFDVLRREIWSCPGIAPWYKQNTIFYLKRDTPSHASFMSRYLRPTTAMFDLVHPEQYRGKVNRLKNGLAIQKLFNYFRLSGGVRRSTVLSAPLNGDSYWNRGKDAGT
jgi:SAM-dependent methyltransferase